MSEHVYDRYRRACNSMEQAERTVQGKIDALAACAAKLQHWRTIAIEDRFDQLRGGSKIAPITSANNVDVSEYPRIEDIFRFVNEWKNAKQEATGAWQAMSRDQQQTVACRH